MTLLVLRNNEDGTTPYEYDNFEAFVKELQEGNDIEKPQFIPCDCEMCEGKGYRYDDYGCNIFYELAKKGHLQLKPQQTVTEYVLK